MLEVMAEFTQKEILLACEDFHIYEINPEYNLAIRAGSNQGYKHTEEAKQNIKKAAMRRGPISIETRMRVSINSAVARWFLVSLPDGSLFTDSEETQASSIILRTCSVVAAFIGCDERTVRRALASGKLCRGWVVTPLGRNCGKTQL